MVRQHPRARGADGGVRRDRAVDDGAEGRGIPAGLEVGEVERLVHLIGTDPLGGALGGGQPRLGAEGPVAVVLGEEEVPVAIDLVHAVLAPVRHVRLVAAHRAALGGGGVVGEAVGLDQAVRHVDAETVDPAVEPEPQDAAELLADLFVRPVEVGLGGVEEVQVPLAGRPVGFGDAGPGGAAEDGVPVVRGELAVLATAVAEHVARALAAAGSGGEGLLEPLVLVGGVVGDEVDDDPDVAGVRLGEHRVEVVERAEDRVDVAVVGDVVAGILLR